MELKKIFDDNYVSSYQKCVYILEENENGIIIKLPYMAVDDSMNQIIKYKRFKIENKKKADLIKQFFIGEFDEVLIYGQLYKGAFDDFIFDDFNDDELENAKLETYERVRLISKGIPTYESIANKAEIMNKPSANPFEDAGLIQLEDE